MPIVIRDAVRMLIPVLTAVMFGCTERVDLAPVRSGHQHIDSVPDVPYPAPVARGNVQSGQRPKEMPPVPRRSSSTAAMTSPSVGEREVSAKGAGNPVGIPSRTVKAKTNPQPRPKTIASKLTTEKSIMPAAVQKKPARDASVSKQKSTGSLAKKENAVLHFDWPLSGDILKNFNQTGKKGIKIAGRKGQTVRAAESGKVVYSGQGLIGYGNLLIIKHNEQYLTAYANNSDLLAKEGDTVKKGQGIARVGSGASHKAMLHFEIRKFGKSVNPLALLP